MHVVRCKVDSISTVASRVQGITFERAQPASCFYESEKCPDAVCRLNHMKRPRGKAAHDPNRKTRAPTLKSIAHPGMQAAGSRNILALLDAALAAIDGMSDRTGALGQCQRDKLCDARICLGHSENYSVSTFGSKTISLYALLQKWKFKWKLPAGYTAQSMGKICIPVRLFCRALGTVASNETKGAMDSDNLRIMAVLVDTSINLVHGSRESAMYYESSPVFKWAVANLSSAAFCPDDTSTDACALPYYTWRFQV